jgi:DNA-directed RNA polymerase specialized sigma24 family protein
MKPIQLPPQTPEQLEALDHLYRTTKDVRLRQRAQLVLLAVEKELVAAEIGEIVRLSEESVRRWLKRYWFYRIWWMREGVLRHN